MVYENKEKKTELKPKEKKQETFKYISLLL